MLRSKVQKKLVVVIAAGALVLAAVLLLVLLRAFGLRPGEAFAIVYAKGSQNLFLALPEGQFPLQAKESKRQVAAGSYLYYDAAGDDSLSLYVCALREADSRKTGGSLVEAGVGEDWTVSADGGRVVYLLQKGKRLLCYDAKLQTTQALADGVEALYAAQGQDVFFFTKPENGASVLFRCAMGQQPERMTGTVQEAQFYADDSRAIIFFVAESGEGRRSLYALEQSGGAVLVADDPTAVFFETYELGGNLYFLKNGAPGAGVSIELTDAYEAGDAAMKEPAAPPKPGRLQSFLEDIFGGSSSNSAYQKELQAWNKKLERDKVRAAAEEALAQLPSGLSQLECYVYDGSSAKCLAKGVTETGVSGMRAFGRAALVFEKERVVSEEETKTVTLDTLVSYYQNSGAKGVKEYLASLAAESAESVGFVLAVMTESGASEIPLGQEFGRGAEWKVTFLRAPDTMLYLERDVKGADFSLYAYDLMSYGLSERRLLDTDVTEAAMGAVGMYYRKAQGSGERGDLYFYHSGPKGEKILANAGAFFYTPDRAALLALSDVDELAGLLNRCAETEVVPVAQQVKIDSVKAGGSYVGYLAAWQEGTGELWVSRGTETRLIDTDVTEIVMIAERS